MKTRDGIREEYWVIKNILEGKFLLYEDEASLCRSEDEAQQFIDCMIPEDQLADHAAVKVTIFEQDICEKCNQRRNSTCRVACNCGFEKCPKCGLTVNRERGQTCLCDSEKA